MLPQALACVVVQVQLPVELTGRLPFGPCSCDMLGCSESLSSHAGPQEVANNSQNVLLQTMPAHVVRGAETGLEGGHGSLEFQAGTMHLATLLAREPQLKAQIHLRDSRCRAAPCKHLLPTPQVLGEFCARLPHAGAAMRPWGAQTSPCHRCCRRAACRAQPLCSSMMPSASWRDPRQALLHLGRHGHKQYMV